MTFLFKFFAVLWGVPVAVFHALVSDPCWLCDDQPAVTDRGLCPECHRIEELAE